jgi:hypothetical protein
MRVSYDRNEDAEHVWSLTTRSLSAESSQERLRSVRAGIYYLQLNMIRQHGFSGLNSQAQANVALYMGVTTIVGSLDDRRGKLKLDAHSSPHVYPLDSVGLTDDYSLLIGLPQWGSKLTESNAYTELTQEETKAQIAETARRGTRCSMHHGKAKSAMPEEALGYAEAPPSFRIDDRLRRPKHSLPSLIGMPGVDHFPTCFEYPKPARTPRI